MTTIQRNLLLRSIIIVSFIVVTVLYVGFPMLRRMGTAQFNLTSPQMTIQDKTDITIAK